jgi:hypothetical protein
MATRGKNNVAYLQSVRIAQKIREEESYECTQSVAGGGGGGVGVSMIPILYPLYPAHSHRTLPYAVLRGPTDTGSRSGWSYTHFR